MSGGTALPEGRRVRVTVPVRVCDVGGWTDTWFGAPGRVSSLAVGPGVEVSAAVEGGSGDRAVPAGSVRLVAPDVGEDFVFNPAHPLPGRQPLLEHAVCEVLERAQSPVGVEMHPVRPPLVIRISSAVPVGASLGTSAAVVVAVLGALDVLLEVSAAPTTQGARPSRAWLHGLAQRAHRVETERAGREAGVQDYWAAALGGVQDLVVDPYPTVRSGVVALSSTVRAVLRDRLVTVAFGAHDSSALHRSVIEGLASAGVQERTHVRGALQRLAAAAAAASAALQRGDLDEWAAVLVQSVDIQAALHPGLVGDAHRAAIDIAAEAGAAGWKVNGAGGAGGSLTILAGEGSGSSSVPADELCARLAACGPGWSILRLEPAAGLAVDSC